MSVVLITVSGSGSLFHSTIHITELLCIPAHLHQPQFLEAINEGHSILLESVKAGLSPDAALLKDAGRAAHSRSTCSHSLARRWAACGATAAGPRPRRLAGSRCSTASTGPSWQPAELLDHDRPSVPRRVRRAGPAAPAKRLRDLLGRGCSSGCSCACAAPPVTATCPATTGRVAASAVN
jgi:hypothetical protein